MTQVLEPRVTAVTDPSTWYLIARVELLGARVAAAVARRRALDLGADEGFRGLYVSSDEVNALLGRGPQPIDARGFRDEGAALEDEADDLESEGAVLRLRRLARAFGLDPLDVDVLLIALAPDVEPRFERLYAYLQDDVTMRRPGPALALELAGGPAAAIAERRRLGATARLRAARLVEVDDADRPFLTRPLRVRDRVIAHLLGDDAPDPAVVHLLGTTTPLAAGPRSDLARAVGSGAGLVYVRDASGVATSAAASACSAAGRPPLFVDLGRVAPDDADDLAIVVGLEAALRGATLLAGPVEAVEHRPAFLRALTGLAAPVVLVGARPWDALWAADPPVVAEPPPFGARERAAVWARALDGAALEGVDAAQATAQFRLTPDQIARAARAALNHARAAERPVTPDDLRRGARLQSSSGLDRLARRVEPRAQWEDLVVPAKVEAALRELTARARHRERVLSDWEMGGRFSRRRGVIALFTGPSGTGKTLSAEVLAHDLGLDLYVVDVATVVDKYVGETEKNLDRIFTEADRVNAVLLFDEADALFGKRSGVEDARDRYANIEVSYLLQRIESFDGIALLTSNLRGNLDEAFTRRLDALIEVPAPDAAERLRLWEANLPAALPRAGELDLAFLARFKLSGGSVRNACVAAAFRAAGAGRAVEMADLVGGVAQEYAKLGHMCTEGEFGRYHAAVRGA